MHDFKVISTQRHYTSQHGRHNNQARLFSNKPDGDSIISEIEENSSLFRTKKNETSEVAKSSIGKGE